MNAEELEKFKQLLAAYDQALRLQRMRERTIETYRQYLWAPRKISAFQCFCGHEKAANRAA
jgi:hypothetical protein